jgi:hypothetical protein
LIVERSADATSWEPLASLDASTTTWRGTGIVSTQPLPDSAGFEVTVQDPQPIAMGHPKFLRLSVFRQILDLDGDGMSDDYEAENGLDLDHDDTILDRDGDGIRNGEEFRFGLKANARDSDGDGLFDSLELDPTQPDRLLPPPSSHPTTALVIYLPLR